MKIQETGKPEYFYIRFVEDEGSCGELWLDKGYNLMVTN
jgi:hypothetical protein